MSKKVTILNFSHRKDGNCGRSADFIADFYNRTNVAVYSVSIVPCCGCNYECLTPGVVCPNVNDHQKEVMGAVIDSDLVYIIVPNYCGYTNANYFAYNERTVGYFNMDRELMNRYMSVPKRFIVVSNTEGENFANALRQQVEEDPIVFYMKSGKYRKRSTAGDILDSEEAVADLKAFLEQNG